LKTQLQSATEGKLTPQMEQVAKDEGLEVDHVMALVAEGKMVIPYNNRRTGGKAVAIGRGVRTKVNANIGTSDRYYSVKDELAKAQAAVEAGADAIMDLSTGGDIVTVRKAIREKVQLPLGTVPIYQAAVEAISKQGAVVKMEEEDLFAVIRQQAEEGVDFMTLHCGLTRNSVERLQQQGRITGIVSRGGSFLTAWILHNERENPLYEQYDLLLEIAAEYDITLSLGDGLRPGCIADATDRAQIQELIILGELVQRARKAGVQVMVEGPGHVPLDQVEANVLLQKQLCQDAPFYVLGPLVTDIATGYDHIAGAIGGAIAAAKGADFLCYLTPAEHLGLPSADDVREGVIASRIAAHAGDLVKNKQAQKWDNDMAQARVCFDWEQQIQLSLDPVRARRYREQRNSGDIKGCSMCGNFCAMEIVSHYLKAEEKDDS